MTAAGAPILRGEEPILLPRERSAAASASLIKKQAMPRDAAASELYETLRAARTRLAREQNVPAYVIFHDTTLLAIAAARPATPQDLAGIPGMGAKKIERYGAAVLAAVAGAP
jgi:ATP-dependent DNA helicase RecQ